MSSIDQAFVKAFARRSRPATTAASQTTVDEGSLSVDRSVAQTARVWVDPVEDQLVRADHSQPVAPKPHVEPAPTQHPPAAPKPPTETADASAHLHTAYAIASLTTDAMHSPTKISPWASIAVEQPITADAAESPVTAPATEVFDPGIHQPDVPEHGSPVIGTRVDAPETEISLNVPLDPVAAGQPAPVAEEAAEPPVALFRPAWEVDVFDVPNNVADLFFDGHLFQQIANRILDAVNTGLSSVLVTSARAGEGRSTVAIGVAMAAAAAGIRVALVDADSEKPTLIDDLGLELQYGWVDTIRGGLPIQEVAVHAVEDGVTLIPLMPPQGHTAATAYEISQLMKLLKNKFDLVVVDGPAGTSATIGQCASVAESAIIVRDVTQTDANQVHQFSRHLRDSGVQGIGIVENFA